MKYHWRSGHVGVYREEAADTAKRRRKRWRRAFRVCFRVQPAKMPINDCTVCSYFTETTNVYIRVFTLGLKCIRGVACTTVGTEHSRIANAIGHATAACCMSHWNICVIYIGLKKISDGRRTRVRRVARGSGRPLEGARTRHQRPGCRRPLTPERAALDGLVRSLVGDVCARQLDAVHDDAAVCAARRRRTRKALGLHHEPGGHGHRLLSNPGTQ